ncbi:MAG: type II toxin-antitoxin system death-on-curing family toxin [Rubricoccaceae bacterium]
MTEPLWISRSVIEAMHQDQLHRHGGRFGIRDENMLESALARPQQKWAYEDNVEFADLAAAYGFGIAKNHPFVDGNKRTAFMSLYSFLRINGVRLMASEPEAVEIMLGAASGELGEAALATWCRQRGEAVSE